MARPTASDTIDEVGYERVRTERLTNAMRGAVVGMLGAALLLAGSAPGGGPALTLAGQTCALVGWSESHPTPSSQVVYVTIDEGTTTATIEGSGYEPDAPVTLFFYHGNAEVDSFVLDASPAGEFSIDLEFDHDDKGPWEVQADDAGCSTYITVDVNGDGARLQLRTFLCPPAIQTASAARAAAAGTCPLAVLPADMPPPPHNKGVVAATFSYTVSDGDRSHPWALASRDGAAPAIDYAFEDVELGHVQVNHQPPTGYRLGTSYRIGGSVAVDTANRRLTFSMSGVTRLYVYDLVGTTPFTDLAGSSFIHDIDWLFRERITAGCSTTRFCPDAPVTREQMASFLVRALDLPAAPRDFFTDDGASPHQSDINRLAAAGITGGCTVTRFCPTQRVTREQMASFLARALKLPATSIDFFADDESSGHEGPINRVAAAEITGGCATRRYCPSDSVSRGQMAAFLHRALD